MRTDTIFYQLFLTFHSLLFELLGQPLENADYYQFTSAEIKEKSFRFDRFLYPTEKTNRSILLRYNFKRNPIFIGN
jgi:predicted transposase YdaD